MSLHINKINQSIGFEKLYNFGFGCLTIGWSVRP